MTDELDSLDEALLQLHHGHQIGDKYEPGTRLATSPCKAR